MVLLIRKKLGSRRNCRFPFKWPVLQSCRFCELRHSMFINSRPWNMWAAAEGHRPPFPCIILFWTWNDEAVCEPCYSYVCTWCNDCVILTDRFVWAIAAKIIDAIDFTRVDFYFNLNVLGVGEVNVVAFRGVVGIEPGCTFLRIVIVCTFQGRVIIPVFVCFPV